MNGRKDPLWTRLRGCGYRGSSFPQVPPHPALTLPLEFSVYPALRFYYTKRSFILVPKDPNAPEELVFDRTKAELVVSKQPRRTNDSALSGNDNGDEEQKVFDVHGIIGVLNLSGGPHLAVIRDRSFACSIDDVEIFRIDEVRLVPLS